MNVRLDDDIAEIRIVSGTINGRPAIALRVIIDRDTGVSIPFFNRAEAQQFAQAFNQAIREAFDGAKLQ